jgi:hypothetical protein
VLWAIALGSLVLAVVFAVWRPNRAHLDSLPGWRRLVLRWGHSLVWLLLAAWAALAALGVDTLLALAAGIAYAVFIVTLLRSRKD